MVDFKKVCICIYQFAYTLKSVKNLSSFNCSLSVSANVPSLTVIYPLDTCPSIQETVASVLGVLQLDTVVDAATPP